MHTLPSLAAQEVRIHFQAYQSIVQSADVVVLVQVHSNDGVEVGTGGGHDDVPARLGRVRELTDTGDTT